jgi:purine catabolism regulator
MMGISVKNLLETDFFANTKILAGEKGIHKEVNSVTVIDAPEGVKWLKGGELALTTAYSIKDDEEKQIELIEELVKANSSGLGIKLRYLNNQIPEKMKAKSDELGFTIFELDESYSWADIISFVMYRTVIPGAKELGTNGETYKVFLDKIYREEGFIGIVEVLEYYTKLNSAIVYNDIIYKTSSNYFPEEKILHRENYILKETIKGYFSTMDKDLYVYEIKTDKGKVECMAIDIVYDYKKVGYVLLLLKDRPLKEEDYILLGQASMVAEAEARRLDVSLTVRREHRRQLINDLLNLKIYSYDEAVYKFKELKWNLCRRNYVLLVKILDNISLENLNDYITKEFDEMIHSIYDKKYLAFILPDINNSIYTTIEEIKSIFYNMLGNSFQIGLGSAVDFQELNRSLNEAKKVIKVASKDYSLKGVYNYKDIGFYRFIDFQNSYNEIEKYVNDYLRPLIYSEKENKDELLETLIIFLENGCNYKDTAEKMYMHPNSIRYRIEIIQDMYGIDLNFCKNKINIAIALKLLPFINKK